MPDAAAPRPLIRYANGAARIEPDAWTVLEEGGDWDGQAYRIVPLKLALLQADRLAGARPIGVWLGPGDEPADAAALFARIDLIGVRFPTFNDGRGYSTASLLRMRLGWRGELRAIGDVLQDQLYFLRRVGFDSFALRADRDPQQALQAFATFSDCYQGSVVPDLPHYRRAQA